MESRHAKLRDAMNRLLELLRREELMGSYRKRSSDMKGIKSRESELLGKGLGTIRQARIRLGPALDSGEEGLVERDLVEPLVEHCFRQDFETKERTGCEGTMGIT